MTTSKLNSYIVASFRFLSRKQNLRPLLLRVALFSKNIFLTVIIIQINAKNNGTLFNRSIKMRSRLIVSIRIQCIIPAVSRNIYVYILFILFLCIYLKCHIENTKVLPMGRVTYIAFQFTLVSAMC